VGWKKILKKVGKAALTGGRIAASFDPTGIAENVLEALKGAGVLKDPAAEAKAREILLEHERAMAALEMEFIKEVNATMRAEAQSGSWWQRSWRPMAGYTLCAVVVNNYILVPYLAKYGVLVITIPSEVWVMLMAVVGVAAWTRGKEKEVRIQSGNK